MPTTAGKMRGSSRTSCRPSRTSQPRSLLQRTSAQGLSPSRSPRNQLANHGRKAGRKSSYKLQTKQDQPATVTAAEGFSFYNYRFYFVLENSLSGYPSLAPRTRPPPPSPLLLHAPPAGDHTWEWSGTCKKVLPEGLAPTEAQCLQLPPR